MLFIEERGNEKERERERKRTGMIKMTTGHQIAIRLMGREKERQLSTIEGRTSI